MGILDAIGYEDQANSVDFGKPLPLTPEQASQSYKAAAAYDVTPDDVTQGMRDEHQKKLMFEGTGEAFRTKMSNPTFRAAVRGDEKSPSTFEEIALSIAPSDKNSGDWSDIARRGLARSTLEMSTGVMYSDAVDLREELDELRKPGNEKEWERRHAAIEQRLYDIAARYVREQAIADALRPDDSPMTKIGQAWNEKGALAAVGEFFSHPIDSATELFSEASLPMTASMGAGAAASAAAGAVAGTPAWVTLAVAMLVAGGVDASISSYTALPDRMAKAGVDMKDAASIADFLIRDARFNRTWGKAQDYGTTVGVGTTASLGFTRVTTPVRLGEKAAQIAPRAAKVYEAVNANAYRHMLQNFGTQAVIQGSIGAGAEAAGQVAADGRVTDSFSVFLNGVSDMITAPIELGVSSYAVRQGVRMEKARTEFNSMQLQKAVQVAKNSQAFEKTPELFNEFADAVGEQNPGIANVGIDVASLHQDGEAGAAAVEAIKEILPQMAKQIDEAVQTGSVVELPLADYIRAAKDDRVTTPVSRHSVVGSDASLAQAERAEAAVIQDRDYGIARLSKGQSPEFKASLQKVAKEYAATLEALPGMEKKGGDEKERRALVALTMNHVANMAADAGMLPEEVWRDYGIRSVLSGDDDIVRGEGGRVEIVTDRARAALGGKTEEAEGKATQQTTLGEYYPDYRTIVRWRDANRSTLLHETGHWFLFSRAKLARELRGRPELTQAQKDFILWTERTIKWLGGKDIESFLNLPMEESRAMHEKFARTYEQYLKDGRSPNSALTRVFRLFSGWLKNVVYGVLNAVPGSAEMKPDVQELFDALFVSSEQIQEAQLRRHLFLALDNVRNGEVPQDGAENALVRAMNVAFKNADDAAMEKFNRRGEVVVGRIRRLRDRIYKDLTKQADALRRQYEAEIINERLGKRRLDAEIFFETAQTRYGKRGAVRKVKPKLYAMELSKAGIDTWRIDELQKRGWVSQRDEIGVIHQPELVSEQLGFSSLDEMVSSLTTDIFEGKAREKWAEPFVQERMQNEHPELAEKETIADSADAAVFNLTSSQMVALEIQYLEGAKGKPVEVALFDAVANASLSDKAITDVKPKTMRTAATRFAEQAQDMMKKGDLFDAATLKRKQLLQMRMADIAQDFLDRAESFVKKMQKTYAPSKMETKSMPIDYFEQVQKMLYLMGINRTAPAYEGIVDYDAFYDFEKNFSAVPERPSFVGTKRFDDMTVAEAREAMQFVEDLIQAGRDYYKNRTESIKLNAKQLDESIAGEIVAGSEARGVKAKRRNDNDHSPWLKRKAEGLTGFVYGHLRFQTLWNVFTGRRDSVFSQAIGAAIDAARDAENDMQFKAATKFDAAMHELEAAITDDKVVYYSELGGSFDKRQIVAMALNIGNEENFQRLLDGSVQYVDFRNAEDLNRPWTKENVLSAIGKTLSKKELDAVQKVWGICGDFGRDLQTLEQETRNRRMLLVKPMPVTIRLANGESVALRGGYYPIEYDGRRSAFDRKEEIGGGMQAARKSTTHAINRAGSGGGRAVALSMGAGYTALNETIHDLAWRRILMDVEKLLRANTATSNAILKYYGREAYDEAKGWLKDMWDNGKSLKVDGFQTFLRKNASIAGLGLNFVTALLQPLGYTQSIAMVGGKWCAGAMATYLHNPRKASQFVMSKSKLMESRMRTRFKELREVQALYEGGDKKVKDALIRKCFVPIAFSQMYTVDLPTWMAAYNKAIAEGKFEGEAVSIADRALVEAQGGGDFSDLARQERTRNVFNVFYGFFGTVLNAVTITANTTKGVERAMKLAMILVVQPVLESFLRAGLDQATSDDNQDYMDRVIDRIPKDLGSFYLGMLMGVREFVPALEALTGSTQGYSGPTGMRMVGDAVRFTQQVGQGDFDRALRKTSVNFILGDLAGLPSTEINRLLDAGEAMVDDEWADAVLYALAGKKGK